MQKKINLLFLLFTLFAGLYAQNSKLAVKGQIFDKATNKPLQYATFSIIKSENKAVVSGGLTDEKGNFNGNLPRGTFDFTFDFIGYKKTSILNKTISQSEDFGIIFLEEDTKLIEAVEIRAEKSTVEIKLDKKVYNVGKDMITKGGTLGDVLNNVPSVTVDAEGTVALRGNESVTVLIDGKPSGLVGLNISDALKIYNADAVDKIEIITNPSARYDAEGGGGIINIILKKGKTNGTNGSFVLSGGYPETYGATGSINHKNELANFFANGGYNYRTNKGVTKIDSKYLNSSNEITRYLNERRENSLLDESNNFNFGVELNVSKSSTWTNAVTFRKGREFNPEDISQNYFSATGEFEKIRIRNSDVFEKDQAIEYSTNFTHKFKNPEHKLTVDYSISNNTGNDSTTIIDYVENLNNSLQNESTLLKTNNKRTLIQTDYVLPFKENSRFEVGYRGNFLTNISNFEITPNSLLSNNTEYVENINAAYLQFGSKIKSFSYFLGLRYEDSHIEINALNLNNYNTKKYHYFFPTATFNYELKDESIITLSYSRRINRPRGRFITPISSYTSNINIIVGNPNINPTTTNAVDLSYLKKFDKLTLSTSAYVNFTNDVFQFTRRESGLLVDGIPVILASPTNLAKEFRYGFEFNINYTPYSWWKINYNLNTFGNKVRGDFSYTNYLNQTVVQNFDNDAFSLFTRINNKITLPYKIDWQSNIFYEAPQTNAQGKRLSFYYINLAFSKDILKDKGTIAINANNIFNSEKRRIETFIPESLESYSEYQRRQRTVILSFTYRFNKKKNDKEKNKREDGGFDGDMM